MKIAYFDCFAGISGDMTLGALMDTGVPLEWMVDHLQGMPLDGFEIIIEPAVIHGIRAKQVHIELHEQDVARNYADIEALIEKSELSAGVKNNSLKMFEKIAVAESKIHGVPLERVHFHEVGGLDAIIDIVGAALGMEYLGIDKVYFSNIPLGSGFVACSHGTLPVPAPATLAILKNVPVYGGGVDQEMVTPTGAAIISVFADAFGKLPEMKIETVGYGAGRRRFAGHPNVLRVVTGQDWNKTEKNQTGMQKETVSVIETCIDDMNPELFGFLMERLFEDGALDVYWIPVFMKKNRPGTMLQVLCDPAREQALAHRILTETSTSGLRSYPVGRYTLKRENVTVETAYGSVAVKKIIDPDGRIRMVPEYDVCREIARTENLPLQVVYAEVIKACG